MRNRKLTLYILFCLAMMVTSVAKAQVRVFAQVDTEKDIYVGERFEYHIVIDGANRAGQVDFGPLAEFDPQRAGNRDISQRSISIINGQRTENIVKRYVMSYSLTATREGQIQIPSVTVTINGRDYQTNPVQANIIKPGTTDKLDLEVKLSEDECYVGQPVIMTVNFYVSGDIGDFDIRVPALESDMFDIEEADFKGRQVREFALASGINIFVSQHRVTHKGKEAFLITFQKVLIPKRSGDIVMDAAVVSANLAVGRARSNNSFNNFFGSRKTYKRFMASSEPLKLKVLALPIEKEMTGFYGLVGRHTISAMAEPTKVNVGDPITLTIKVGGEYLKRVRWPKLEKVSALADNFKIPSQKATPTKENGYKVFTQTIRANNDKVTEIPPIPLVFFDSDKGKYVTAQSEPIKLDVAATKILTGADMEGLDHTVVNKEVEAIRKGLSANYEGLEVLENMSFSPAVAVLSGGYVLLWGLPLAGLIISGGFKLVTHTSEEKTLAIRRRRAGRNAKAELNKAISASQAEKSELLGAAMKQYIADRFDRLAGALTADDCHAVIVDVAADKTIAGRYRDIIASCEASRYASMESDISDSQIQEAIELIDSIEKRCGK